jgi:4-diphosphocytidyl-2-C-methyl-D-erythritol kinase
LDRSLIAHWQTTVVNTMEPYVLEKFPAVTNAKRQLIENGAVYASMSGSGSTVFGLFTTPPPNMDIPTGARTWTFAL